MPTVVSPRLRYAAPDPTEENRYHILRETLRHWAHLFRGQIVLDYGAASGLSAAVLLEHGAAQVIGVEVDERRVARRDELLRDVVERGVVQLLHVPDTRALPFSDGRFPVVLANAVFEHIPQPRALWIREIWRVVGPGGHLIINETPNKYYPRDLHTTGLWFNHWLPSGLARRHAIWRLRFRQDRPWASSGWRGVGYYELRRHLPGAMLVPERTHLRHRLLTAVGLPASLCDPYPTWVFQKTT
jgi:SAM-dependent methyltransferase